MLFRIEHIASPVFDDTVSAPPSGQVVELLFAPLNHEGMVFHYYRLMRPNSAHDNRLWAEKDFGAHPYFSPRWQGYEDLEDFPRETYGYLLVKRAAAPMRSPGDIDRATDFTPQFECVVKPVTTP